MFEDNELKLTEDNWLVTIKEAAEVSDASDKDLTLDEKQRLAIKQDSFKIEEEMNLNKNLKIRINQTEQNKTGTTVHTLNTLNDTDERQINYENIVKHDENFNLSIKSKKIFRIKKYVKYNKYLSEICSDEEISENDKKELNTPKSRKISPFSKVNFSKLKPEEKDDRLKNLAKLVKRLRRKVINLENKVRFNATKLLNKHIWNKLGINSKNKYLQPEFQFDFDKIWRALRKVKNYEEFEYDDQKHLIENIINFIAEEKLKINSLAYKKICSLLRPLVPKEKIKYISKIDSKITISFPETEINISNKEYSKIAKFKDSEEILRAVLGVYEENEKTVIVTSEAPSELKDNLNNVMGGNFNNFEKMNNLNQNVFPNNNFGNFLNNNRNNNFFNQPKGEVSNNNNFSALNSSNMMINMNNGNLNALYNNVQNETSNNTPNNYNICNNNDQSVYFNNNCNSPQFQQFLMNSFRNFYTVQNNKNPSSLFNNMNFNNNGMNSEMGNMCQNTIMPNMNMPMQMTNMTNMINVPLPMNNMTMNNLNPSSSINKNYSGNNGNNNMLIK